MREQSFDRRGISRRTFLEGAGLITGGVIVTGGMAIGFAELTRRSDLEDRQDKYQGIPLSEYAKGSFTINIGGSTITRDPVIDPKAQEDAGRVTNVNGKYVGSGEFIIRNPGIVRAKSPDELRDNAPWVVLNAEIAIPATGLKQFAPDHEARLLYVYLADQNYRGDPARPIEFGPLTTNPDGTHIEPISGRQVDYLGAIGFPPQGIRFNL